MIPVISRLTPFVTLKTVYSDKFKTERISVLAEAAPDERLTPVTKMVFSILKRGCKEYQSRRELSKRMDDLYSASVYPLVSKVGAVIKFGFGAEMICGEYVDGDVDILGGTLELLFKLFFEPLTDENGHFSEKYIESERENICDQIRSVINVPRAYASKRLTELMYEGDSYAIPTSGTVETVSSIRSEELINAYNDITKNSSFEVFYIGTRSHEEMASVLKRLFSKYKVGAEKKLEKNVCFSVNSKNTRCVDEEKMLSQSILAVGFKTGVNISCGMDFYNALVLNEIFGGSPVSKLFMNVRERLGLCYYCSSSYDANKGHIAVFCGIEDKQRKKAEAEILKQFKNIAKGRVSESEFSMAKKSLINVYSETTDSQSAIERFYAVRAEYGINESIEEAKSKVNEVKLEDVVKLAKQTKLDTVYFLCGKGQEHGS